jgi:hypothetical protein
MLAVCVASCLFASVSVVWAQEDPPAGAATLPGDEEEAPASRTQSRTEMRKPLVEAPAVPEPAFEAAPEEALTEAETEAEPAAAEPAPVRMKKSVKRALADETPWAPLVLLGAVVLALFGGIFLTARGRAAKSR